MWTGEQGSTADAVAQLVSESEEPVDIASASPADDTVADAVDQNAKSEARVDVAASNGRQLRPAPSAETRSRFAEKGEAPSSSSRMAPLLSARRKQ